MKKQKLERIIREETEAVLNEFLGQLVKQGLKRAFRKPAKKISQTRALSKAKKTFFRNAQSLKAEIRRADSVLQRFNPSTARNIDAPRTGLDDVRDVVRSVKTRYEDLLKGSQLDDELVAHVGPNLGLPQQMLARLDPTDVRLKDLEINPLSLESLKVTIGKVQFPNATDAIQIMRNRIIADLDEISKMQKSLSKQLPKKKPDEADFMEQ